MHSLFYIFFMALVAASVAGLPSCQSVHQAPSAPIGTNAEAPRSSTPPGSKNAQGSDSSSGGPQNDKPDCDQGAPVWHVDFNNQNLVVRDTPLWLNTPYGDNIRFSLTYNLLAEAKNQYATGIRWSNSFHEFISFDSEKSVYKHYSGDGRIDIYLHPEGETQYQVDSQYLMSGEAANQPIFMLDGTTIRLSYPSGYQQQFTQLTNGRFALSVETDPYGNQTQYAYQNDQLTSVSSADGKAFRLAYNADGLLTQVTGPAGRRAVLEYNEDQELVAITDMQGYRAQLNYDNEHYISAITDAKGTTKFRVERGYADKPRTAVYPDYGEPLGLSSRLTVTDPLGNQSEYFYNSESGESWYVSPEHYVAYQSDNINNAQASVPKKVYTYTRYTEGYSRVKKVAFPDNSWIEYSYDDQRHLSGINYSTGEAYAYINNEKGLTTQYTDPAGNVTTYSYDDQNNLTQAVGMNGTRTYSYDAYNQLISKTDVSDYTTQYSYNSQGQLALLTNAKQQTLQYQYGVDGYLSSIGLSGVTLVSYQYDNAGRLTRETDRYGRTQSYSYDKINQLTEISALGGRQTKTLFGSCPRMLSSQTLPGDRTYTYQYDAAKRLTTVVDPMQGQTRLLRNKNGRITGLVDANQNQTKFSYDPAGRLKGKTYADGTDVSYVYTGQGQLQTKTNARGIIKTYQYNAANQLTAISYSDGTAGVTYQYDSQGRVSQITDGTGTTTYQYAATGELLSVDGPLDDDTITLSHDELYRISAISVNGQTNSQYLYDAFGRLSKITALGESFTFSYQDTQLTPGYSLNYPNGLKQTVTTDSAGDLSSIVYAKNSTAITNFGYGFNLAGNLTALETSEPLNFESAPYKATYNKLNQISSYNGQAGVFQYDPDGNLTAGVLADGTSFTAEYDAENRLAAITFTRNHVITTERFSYNYQHFMTGYEREENGLLTVSKQFVRLGLLELQERDGEGNVIAENAWRLDAPGGIGGLLIRKTGAQKYTYLTNHLGHVYGVLDQDGNRVSNHSYSPYGMPSGNDFSVQPFGMSTKRSDFSSGLVYFGYRFYMPHLGRWLNRDPLQEQGGINLYAYVNGDPFGYVDPDGRWAFHLNLFLGAGGGITIGYNPNNNKSFWEARLGYGYDLGLKLDPTDNGDESRQAQACGPNAMMGAEAQWGAGIMGLDVHGGTKSEFLDVAEGPDNDLLVPHVGGNTLELGKPSLAAGAHVGLYIHVVY